MQMLNESKLKERITSTTISDIESGKIGGAAITVLQDGKTVYQELFGDQRIGIQVTERTLFRMASMTKPITTIAVLLLIDWGELDLDTPVSKFIPQLSQMNVGRIIENQIEIAFTAKTPIKIRHLLSHSSGMGSGPIGDYLRTAFPLPQRKNLEQMVRFYADNPLDFEPFTKQAYSSWHAFDVLARTVEIISGMSYDNFLEKEIFRPLGMIDTTFSPNEEQWSRIIPMHSYENGTGKVVDFPHNSLFEGIPTYCLCAGAGLASTLQDYKKFATMLLNNGSIDGCQLVSEKLIKEMSSPQLPLDIMSGQEVWGLGVRVIADDSHACLPRGSFGWSGAYGTHFWVDPVNRITAIYLKNSRYDGGSGAMTARHFEQDVMASFQ